MYLIVDTSTKHGAVGLWRDGSLVRTAAWRSRYHHTVELMPAIEHLLGQESLTADGLQGIAVATGPGGFSALRAGLSVTKGLAFALSLPVAGVNTLEASAYPYRDLGFPVCPLLQLSRDLVAWARFQQDAHGVAAPRPRPPRPAGSAAEAPGEATPSSVARAQASFHSQLATAMGPLAHLAGEPSPQLRLSGVALLGADRLAAGDHDTLSSLRPHYLRAPGITKPKPPRVMAYGSPRRDARP